MSREKENKKKYVLFKIVQILKGYSDREHPMLQKELVEKLHELDYTTDRSTVRRALIDLTSDPESRVHSYANETHEEIDSERDYYFSGIYYDQEFTEAELRWLIDGILYSRNVPHAERDLIISKLCELGNNRFQKYMNMKKIRRLAEEEPMNDQLFVNIEKIGHAIDEGKKITTVYNYMGPDFELHPVYGNPNYHQLLNPYAMVCRNGFYFLICNKDNHNDMTNYRIDRMTNVTITDLAIKSPRELDGFEAGWNLQEYMEQNINMAFGKPELITFKATTRGIPYVIDAFGKNVEIKEMDTGEYHCTVRIPFYDMERWALENWKEITVLSPKQLVNSIQSAAQEIMQQYQTVLSVQ